MRAILGLLDFLVRWAFFLIAPIVLFMMANLLPMTGAFVYIALALTVFFLGATIRHQAEIHPWVAWMFRRQLAFESYYHERPPRPFLYYVLYPLFLPYWLFNRDARREFLLLRGYTGLTFVILIAFGVREYFALWRPELTFRNYLGLFVAMLLFEWLTVLILLMPITTTVVRFTLEKKRVRLVILLVTGLFMLVGIWMAYAKKRHTLVSISTSSRMFLRSNADQARSREARAAALLLAWKTTFTGATRFEKNASNEVELLGDPIDAARGELKRFYKEDETQCFHLLAIATKEKGKMLILFGDPYNKKRKPVWIALRGRGEIFDDEASLPSDAIDRMRRTAMK